NDKKGKPAGKYSVLADAQQWATNVGFPGYANAAVDEIYSTRVLNTMFGQASTGAMPPEDAVKEADAKCRKIWQKWKERNQLQPGPQGSRSSRVPRTGPSSRRSRSG